MFKKLQRTGFILSAFILSTVTPMIGAKSPFVTFKPITINTQKELNTIGRQYVRSCFASGFRNVWKATRLTGIATAGVGMAGGIAYGAIEGFEASKNTFNKQTQATSKFVTLHPWYLNVKAYINEKITKYKPKSK